MVCILTCQSWEDGQNTFLQRGEELLGNSLKVDNLVGHLYPGGYSYTTLESVAAFTNASTNSYKRLIPGFEAPSILTYSSQNRSASCRIPYGAGEKSTRIEMRFQTSTGCPLP